ALRSLGQLRDVALRRDVLGAHLFERAEALVELDLQRPNALVARRQCAILFDQRALQLRAVGARLLELGTRVEDLLARGIEIRRHARRLGLRLTTALSL